jgi:hypothetical protein
VIPLWSCNTMSSAMVSSSTTCIDDFISGRNILYSP